MASPDRTKSMAELLDELRSKPTISVSIAGAVLGDLKRNASYDAARLNKLGVPVIEVGGKKRVPSIAVLRKLGLADDEQAA
jgi:hypothetical protein